MTQSNDDSTQARVLNLIVGKGPVSAAQLAEVLSLTPVAVRRHIIALKDAEQIEVHMPAQADERDRGRSVRHYVLTPKARTSFVEGYSDLTNHTLCYLSQVADDKAVDSFTAARGHNLKYRYTTVVKAASKGPSERTRALANALTLDGYAASVRDIGDGFFVVQLYQDNCPVCDVIGEFHELCDAETQATSWFVGVPVQYLVTLTGGERACATHVLIATPTLCKHAVRAAAKTWGLKTR